MNQTTQWTQDDSLGRDAGGTVGVDEEVGRIAVFQVQGDGPGGTEQGPPAAAPGLGSVVATLATRSACGRSSSSARPQNPCPAAAGPSLSDRFPVTRCVK